MKKKIKFKRLWISVIGWILVGGFVNNLFVAPFTEISLVEWNGLITSLGILLGISGTRDYFLKNSLDKLPENRSGKGWQRMWIPCVGWALAGGFFINCIIAPYLDLRVNDWSQLITALTVILGISGARDVERTSRRIGNHDADGVAALTLERRGAGIHREIRGARECHRSDGTQYSATLHKGCSFFLMQKKSLI